MNDPAEPNTDFGGGLSLTSDLEVWSGQSATSQSAQQRQAVRDFRIHLLQAAEPLLHPALGDLSVTGAQAAVAADAALLLAGVVAA